MKKHYALILTSLLLALTWVSILPIPMVQAANPGDIIAVGDTIDGTFTPAKNDDYYSIEIVEPGTYNLTMIAFDCDGYARLYEMNYGFLGGSIAQANANGSDTLEIYPGVRMFNLIPGIYTLKVHRSSGSETGDYQVTFTKMTPDLETVQADANNTLIVPESDLTYFTMFNATSNTNCYNITAYMNDTDDYYVIEVLDGYGEELAEWWIFTNGTWEIFAINHRGSPDMPNITNGFYLSIWYDSGATVHAGELILEVNGYNATLLSPGIEIEFDLNSANPRQREQYLLFNLTEALYYDIWLNVPVSSDGEIEFYTGPSTLSSSNNLDVFGYGEDENITQFLILGGSMWGTTWGTSNGTHWGYFDWDYDTATNYIDSGHLLVRVEADSGLGEFELIITGGTPLESLNTSNYQNPYLNNTFGPFYAIYRLDVDPMSSYSLKFNQTALNVTGMRTDMQHFTTYSSESFYRDGARFTLPSDYAEFWDPIPVLDQSSNWQGQEENETVEFWDFYRGTSGSQYVVVTIPDGRSTGGARIWSGSFGDFVPIMYGNVNITVELQEMTELSTNSLTEFIVDGLKTPVLTCFVAANHHYEVILTYPNWTVGNAYGVIYDTDGDMIYPGFTPIDGTTHNGLVLDFRATESGQFYIILAASGEGGMTATLRDVTFPSPLALEGLMLIGAAGGCLILGGILGYILAGRRISLKMPRFRREA